ncbi:MAG TPA: hypothetical protein VF574_02300 [Allosphingosinicella sp.]|jgi:hypothetical protein
MIEFEGPVLLPTETLGAESMAILGGSTDNAALDLGGAQDGGPGQDSVLQELSPETGDDWIGTLLSSASSGAISSGLNVPGETDPIDPQSGDDETIVITAIIDEWDYTGPPDGGGSGGGGEGSGGGESSAGGGATAVEQHTQDCGTEDGAAVQVAKHVKGELPPGVSGPPDPITTSSGNDWTKVEFGALIVKNSDGSFGAFNDLIYSNDDARYVLVPYNSTQPIQGFWHTHPAGADSAGQQAINRYPSPFDWNVLSQIAGRSSSVSDPSLWVTGPDGVTREFKLSERSYFEDLAENESRMEDGDGLEGRARTQSCG